ncbi:MAG: hypothetical protein R2752_09660 [Vicinamibacterales bacterium]
MRRTVGRSLLALTLAAAAVACEDTQVPTTPTPDPAPTVTDTFNGSLSVNAAATFTFAVAAAGNVVATLTALTPDAAATVGVSIGTWNGSTCQEVLSNDNATQGASITGAVSVATDICVRVRDVGKLSDPQTFTLTVVHP